MLTLLLASLALPWLPVLLVLLLLLLLAAQQLLPPLLAVPEFLLAVQEPCLCGV